MAKYKVNLPGLKTEGNADSPAGIFVAVMFFFALWLGFFILFAYAGFFVLNWALGIFGYHITGLQYIGGWVILGFLRTVISYLFHRE